MEWWEDKEKHFDELVKYVKQFQRPRGLINEFYGFIYVVREKCTGIVKIGHSIDPIKRFKSLKSQVEPALKAFLSFFGSEPELELVTVVYASTGVEWFIRWLLLGESLGGEWYRSSEMTMKVILALENLRVNGYGLDVFDVSEICETPKLPSATDVHIDFTLMRESD